MIKYAVFAMLTTFCFSIIFNIRGKNLFFAAFGGGMGWLFFLICQNHFDLSLTISMLFASIFIGIYSEIMARVNKAPVTIFAIPAILPLVPGNGMYYTMYETVQGNAYNALTLGTQTLASAGAIATGIVLVSSMAKLIKTKNASSKC